MTAALAFHSALCSSFQVHSVRRVGAPLRDNFSFADVAVKSLFDIWPRRGEWCGGRVLRLGAEDDNGAWVVLLPAQAGFLRLRSGQALHYAVAGAPGSGRMTRVWGES